MKDSIHKYFQVGTIHWMSYPKSDPLDSLLAICRDDYFDAIELKGYGDQNAEAKAILEQSHFTPHAQEGWEVVEDPELGTYLHKKNVSGTIYFLMPSKN